VSIFGDLRLPSSTDWIFFGENRCWIDRVHGTECLLENVFEIRVDPTSITQLATHRHPPPFSQKSDTCVHCRVSIFGDLCLPSSTDWIFLSENRRLILIII
jgi:hypothetical protein